MTRVWWATDEYSWDSSDSACLPCPLDALCNGGDDFHPNPGFWRKDNTTALLYRCIIPRACTPEGCAEGYEGPLCDACSSGFGKNGDVCTRCPSTASNIAILTCVAFVLAAITVFVVQRARHRALTREVDKIRCVLFPLRCGPACITMCVCVCVCVCVCGQHRCKDHRILCPICVHGKRAGHPMVLGAADFVHSAAVCGEWW